MYRRVTLMFAVFVAVSACSSPNEPPSSTLTAQPEQTASATANATTQAELTWVEVAKKLRLSTVLLYAKQPRTPFQDPSEPDPAGTGSGIVYKDGYIITNAHVVQNATIIRVFTPGSVKDRAATLIGLNSCQDLAVLKVDDINGLQPATIGNSDSMEVGAEVAALGYPLGFEIGEVPDPSITHGIISSKSNSIEDVYTGHLEHLIQTDAAINGGNSGGPLLNRYGQVIGINTLSYNKTGDATNISFAISIDQAVASVDKMISEREAKGQRQWYDMGMWLEPNNNDQSVNHYKQIGGMVVFGVEPNSPAERIGIQLGDLITQVNSEEITYPAELCTILGTAGDNVPIKLVRREAKDNVTFEGVVAMGSGAANPSLSPIREVGRESRFTREQDEFNVDSTSWPSDSNDAYESYVENGAYKVTLNKANTYLRIPPISSSGSVNMIISADIVFIDQGRVGVGVNASGLDIACWINNIKQYGCLIISGDEIRERIPPTQLSSIDANPGARNAISLHAIDGNLKLFINGNEVETIPDVSQPTTPRLFVQNVGDTPARVAYDTVTIEREK